MIMGVVVACGVSICGGFSSGSIIGSCGDSGCGCGPVLLHNIDNECDIGVMAEVTMT